MKEKEKQAKEEEFLSPKEDVKEEGEDTAGQEEEKEEREKTPGELLEEKEAMIKEITDKYMRALAEVDNARKRASKDRDDLVKFMKSEYVREFIPVMDNLDRAVHASKDADDVKTIKQGVEMILKQFEGIFSKLGIKEIKAKGVFDPMVHHVMHKEHAENKKEGEIIEVYQKGYEMDGMVVRPAMVKVATKKGSEQ
ncbi:MAG TPA: nucleotide exchange factor GrpE [Firmicutes bacterium]|nr:nucleotide exchange factor GrpE [Bacillota bacterium]